eukprot:5289985-Prymnesium_polylepis.1
MEPELNGRPRCGLEPRNNSMSDTNREEMSDFGHVGPDLVYTAIGHNIASRARAPRSSLFHTRRSDPH